MNKKIFTLLASALMLFATAFYANATRTVAERSVGSHVTSIDPNAPDRMYHIQVDSICLRDPSNGKLYWYPVSVTNGSTSKYYAKYNPTTGRFNIELTGGGAIAGDTIVLAATRAGNVRMISTTDMRKKFLQIPAAANLNDLQAAMWCTNVQENAAGPQRHTFHFTNRVYQKPLDWDYIGNTIVSDSGHGWMFSNSWTKLNRAQPFYHLHPSDFSVGEYRVVMADTMGLSLGLPGTTDSISGMLLTQKVDIDIFRKDTVESMLKFSIVGVSPYVLTAEDFNTKLGAQKDGRVTVAFSRNGAVHDVDDNVFKNWLYAEESTTATSYTNDPGDLGYLHVRAYSHPTASHASSFIGYIANTMLDDSDPANKKYADPNGNKYHRLTTEKILGNQDFNFDYRFVYFPTEDSIVVNAFTVNHSNHSTHLNRTYYDNGIYNTDPINSVYFYYGLYNTNIQNALIVRYQDLNLPGEAKDMMTISDFRDNINMSLGFNCNNTVEGWQVPEGVYTIWDGLGRCLGVRIYNGTYTPQWMTLKELYGECPDRIPSYQWVIEKSKVSPRINIRNREFGHMDIGDGIVTLENVLVTRESSQIFKNQNKFLYGPIVDDYIKLNYEPINEGWVTGQVIRAIGATECKTDNIVSGFRPVTNAYVTNPYLGYKHFKVGQNPDGDPSYGKSEDMGDERDMDYTAYTFNYLHKYDEPEEYGIALKERYFDEMLHLEKDPVGFRFLLGDGLEINNHAEEQYGYPKTAWGKTVITDGAYTYTQDRVPVLKRYYYKLKVADFYSYVEGHYEKYIVLKGLGKGPNTHNDYMNALSYGVADISAEADPMAIANVYLRETYYLKQDLKDGEFRPETDDTRRIYYVMLDRIEGEKMDSIVNISNGALRVTDTLMGADGSKAYNLLSLAVDDGTLFIEAQGKVGSSARVSAFSLIKKEYELYRRLRSKAHDIPQDSEAQGKEGLVLDAPKTLRIHRHQNQANFLYEDALSKTAFGKGINFLGVANSHLYPETEADDGTVKYNYHLFIDTAYINRGTGFIKPQYLIAVGVTKGGGEDYEIPFGGKLGNCEIAPNPSDYSLAPYYWGRYLVNATDSGRHVGSEGESDAPVRNQNYIMEPDYDRLIFVDAVHANDRLYIMSELRKYLKESDYIYEYGDAKLFDANKADEAIKKLEDNGAVLQRLPNNSSMLGAYYDFGDWNNYHNDVCFSLRFVSPDAKNADDKGQDRVSTDKAGNELKRFYIESETTHRTPFGNAKIAPVQGGWVKIHNDVPVLSRGDYKDAIQNSDAFNVALPTEWQEGKATSNDNNPSEIDVIAGTDEVTVLNAEGTTVTVSNLLGQTIATVKVSSNNQKIAVSKGIVVVNVDGVKAIKAVVK